MFHLAPTPSSLQLIEMDLGDGTFNPLSRVEIIMHCTPVLFVLLSMDS
jgi:hypothetical protein